MFLTGFLGHRYLWCDRLCLVQDDVLSKLPQKQQMAEIYARAYCTIIAFDNEDANSGLGGLPTLTRRSHRQVSHRQVSTYYDMKPMRWSSRAWTFQEELFSVRVIRLSSHTVDWQCCPIRDQESTYGSDLHDNTRGSNRNNSEAFRRLPYTDDLTKQIGGMFCPRHASLKYYINLAERYSQRHVNEQHPEDIFHAFSSVQSILKASYPGAFIQGIPECLLVQCLLWSTGASSHKKFLDPVTGRKASSWSWIGWFARIYYPGVDNRYFPEPADKDQSLGRREGLVSWYVSLKKDSRLYPVSVAKEEVWASHRKVEGLSSASILPLNASLTGKQDMALESQGFQHIIPLSADSHEPSTLEVKNLCSFLHGRVLMARFRVHFKDTGVTDGERPVRVLLCETSGNYAGVLCGRSDSLEDGQVINLIAISGGPIEAYLCCNYHFFRSGLLHVEVVDQPTPQGCCQPSPLELLKRVYEFYDALWVEYEDGVAYRKGIGRVRKEVWDRETLGWVDITLG